MPERKGRKRKPSRDRGRSRAATSVETSPAMTPGVASPVRARRPQDGGPLPSTTARVTGLMLAVVTAFLALLMIYQAATGDAPGTDRVLRVVAGAALVALAAVVGILSVAPAMVRDWFRRRR